MNDSQFDKALQGVSERLISVAKTQGVLGEAVHVGETVVMPLCEIKIGFGGGGGEGEGEGDTGESGGGTGTGTGGFGGGGVRVTPVAMIVMDKDRISLTTIEEGGAL